MKKTIYKYSLSRKPEQVIKMPHSSNVLCVKLQDGSPRIWAEVVPENSLVERTFILVETGEHYDFVGKYIGTVVLNTVVLHLFEKNT